MRPNLRKAAQHVMKRVQALVQHRQLTSYQNHPVEYITQELKQRLWSKQKEICDRLMTPPYKVMVKACHSVGKTWLSAALEIIEHLAAEMRQDFASVKQMMNRIGKRSL